MLDVRLCLLVALMLSAPVTSTAQLLPPPPPPPPPPSAAPVQKLSETTYRVGQLRIDVARRELVAPGTLNDVTLLEFVANTKDGAKAYESAITIDSNAVTFNTALLLLGLDTKRGVASTRQFDPATPKGDPVDVFVTFTLNGGERTMRVEELLLDNRTGKTVPSGPWVYTGSTFIGTGAERRYLAELDGVLIGLMHGPQAIIENPRNDAVEGYGMVVMNSKLGLPAGTPVTVTIRALPSPFQPR